MIIAIHCVIALTTHLIIRKRRMMLEKQAPEIPADQVGTDESNEKMLEWLEIAEASQKAEQPWLIARLGATGTAIFGILTKIATQFC